MRPFRRGPFLRNKFTYCSHKYLSTCDFPHLSVKLPSDACLARFLPRIPREAGVF
jgi:hypothetical protein